MKSQLKVASLNTLIEMPVVAPKGYHYEAVEHKQNVVSIWLCGGPTYLYKGGESARTIHSFYNIKKKTWYAPINCKKPGKEVSVDKIRPYTSMQLNYNPLELLLYG